MRKNAIGLGIALLVLVSGSLMWAQEQTWVTIAAADRERGAFVPRDRPYTQDGPSVGVYLVDRQDIRMPDGQVLTGFDFIGWSEETGIRVHVFALVPKEGVANGYMPGGDRHNLRRREFASYLIRPGESRPVTEMKALGIEPMMLRSVVRTTRR
jgi:hypothetical protein